MKKIFFFIFAFMLHIGVYAQTNIQEAANTKTSNLDAIVEMTESQEDQVLQINVEKLTEVENLESQKKFTEARHANRDRRNLISDVLTQSQMTTLKQAIRARNPLVNRNSI